MWHSTAHCSTPRPPHQLPLQPHASLPLLTHVTLHCSLTATASDASCIIYCLRLRISFYTLCCAALRCFFLCSNNNNNKNDNDNMPRHNLNIAVKVIATKIVSPFCPTLLPTRLDSRLDSRLASIRFDSIRILIRSAAALSNKAHTNKCMSVCRYIYIIYIYYI